MLRRKDRVRLDPDPWQPSRWRRFMTSQSTLIGSSVFFLVVLACVVYVAIVPGHGTPALDRAAPLAAAPGTGAPAPGQPSTTPVPTPDVCAPQEPTEVMPEILLSTTYSTDWPVADGRAQPESSTGGPLRKDWPRRCFTRTPEGALYAVATLIGESLAATGPSQTLTLARTRFSHTGGYQRQLDQLMSGDSQGIQGTQPDMVISGYRWAGYTPDTATVELQWTYLSGPSIDTTVAVTYQARWEANDWLLIVPANRSALHQDGAASRTFFPWGPA